MLQVAVYPVRQVQLLHFALVVSPVDMYDVTNVGKYTNLSVTHHAKRSRTVRKHERRHAGTHSRSQDTQSIARLLTSDGMCPQIREAACPGVTQK